MQFMATSTPAHDAQQHLRHGKGHFCGVTSAAMRVYSPQGVGPGWDQQIQCVRCTSEAVTVKHTMLHSVQSADLTFHCKDFTQVKAAQKHQTAKDQAWNRLCCSLLSAMQNPWSTTLPSGIGKRATYSVHALLNAGAACSVLQWRLLPTCCPKDVETANLLRFLRLLRRGRSNQEHT